MFTFHATFIPVPQPYLGQLTSAVYTFVAANLCFPTEMSASETPVRVASLLFWVASVLWIALMIRGQLAALLAKIMTRLLEPEHLPWKAFSNSFPTLFQLFQHSSFSCSHQQTRSQSWLSLGIPSDLGAPISPPQSHSRMHMQPQQNQCQPSSPYT